MNKNVLSLLSALAISVVISTGLQAQTQISAHGFSPGGTFHVTLPGAAEVETSTDLQSWSRYASVTQPTMLDDLATRQNERRFYRVRGTSNIVGYLKVVIPPGKLALLGNSFGSPLRLDTPEGRMNALGMTNPPIKVSVYTNGNFVAHNFDPASGSFTPRLMPIRPQEGFALQNTGSSPLTIRLSGVVRQGAVQTSIPAGSALVAPGFPLSGPLAKWLSFQAQDGTQVQWFDEKSQAYQTSTFDTLGGSGQWEPALPELPAGRAVVIKSPQAVSWTSSLPK
jgi:hypothetical protein